MSGRRCALRSKQLLTVSRLLSIAVNNWHQLWSSSTPNPSVVVLGMLPFDNSLREEVMTDNGIAQQTVDEKKQNQCDQEIADYQFEFLLQFEVRVISGR